MHRIGLSALVLVGACGRIGFDALTDSTGDGGRDGNGNGDGNGDGDGSMTTDAGQVSNTFEATGDSFVVQNSVAANGSSMQLLVGTTAAANPGMALLQFDVSSIPSGTPIVSATLRLNQVTSMGTGTINVDVERITSAWDPATVNFASRPTWDPTLKSTKAVPLNMQVAHTWDVKTFVEGWIESPTQNFGLVIEAPTAPSSSISQFGSRENSVVADRPQLVIVSE